MCIVFLVFLFHLKFTSAMFNYRRQRSSNESNAEHIGSSIPAVLQFSHNDYEEYNKETVCALVC